MLLRNIFNPNVFISTPEIEIEESSSSSISDILNIAYNIELLPAPVLPTQPIFYPLLILKEMPFRIKSELALYLI